MSGAGEDKPRRGALLARPGYAVSYGKPPAATQFQKGQSGNPKGRPKGAKARKPALNEERMKTLILEEAYRTIGAQSNTWQRALICNFTSSPAVLQSRKLS